YPALVKTPDKIIVKTTYPAGKSLSDKPNVVIFNNDFALMKVLVDQKGRKTIQNFPNPPIELRTGLLPQDMLVPQGLVIPDNMKGIIGNLQISTSQDSGLKVSPDVVLTQRVSISKTSKNAYVKVPQVQNKILYVATCYSKDIQVINGESRYPSYALAQKGVPIDMKSYRNDKFLLVTVFSKNYLYVISLADDRMIKQIEMDSQPEEIVIDKYADKAYISSPLASCLYVVDLKTMALKQKIKLKGMCEKIALSPDGKKLFYSDKETNEIWAIELDNNYVIKDIGKLQNTSKIAFYNGKVYIASRTKNHLAVIDYATMKLEREIETPVKPIDMYSYNGNVFILGAEGNIIEVLDTRTNEIVDNIELDTNGFSTRICPVPFSNLAIITDTKAGKYSILNLDKKQILRTNTIGIPVSSMIVANRVKKIHK
ncbi:YncE family protein, partial [bacterium]|nr:YncE family protein [bacterium]